MAADTPSRQTYRLSMMPQVLSYPMIYSTLDEDSTHMRCETDLFQCTIAFRIQGVE